MSFESIRNIVAVMTASLLAAGLSACAGEKVKKVEATKAPGSVRNNSDGTGSVLNSPQNSVVPQGNLIDAVYELRIKGIFGAIQVCKGEAQVRLTSTGQFELPKSDVACVGGLIKVDLGSMMKGMSTNPGAGTPPNFSGDDRVVRIDQIAGAKFSPPRPLMIAAFKAKPEDLSGYSGTEVVTATDLKTGQSAPGRITMEVLTTEETLVNPNFSKAFDKVVRWHMLARGFDGLNKPAMFLFDKVEMAWNLDPIAIPEIKIEGHIKEFMKAVGSGGDSPLGALGSLGSGPLAQIATTVAGKVVVELELKSMEGIDP